MSAGAGRAVHRRRRRRATGCGASPTPRLVGRFQALLGGRASRTSPTATTATRRRCATATRTAPTAPGRSATSRRWSAPGLLVLPVPPDPLGGAVARGGGGAAARARFRIARARERRVGRGGRRPGLDARRTRSRSPSRAAARSLVEAEPGAETLLAGRAPPSLRALDTYFLHHAVLGPLLGVRDAAVSYVHSQAEAEEALARGALPARRPDARDAGRSRSWTSPTRASRCRRRARSSTRSCRRVS